MPRPGMRAVRGAPRMAGQNSIPVRPGGRRPGVDIMTGMTPVPVRKPGRARAPAPSPVRLLAPAILGLSILFPAPALADRRPKTVFRSQPVEWNLEEGEDQASPTLVFTPAWTWSGFTAPLAGDPVTVQGSIVAAARDGSIAALRADTGEVAWRAAVEAPLTVGPATDGTLVFLATAGGRLLSLKGADGLPGWTADLASGPPVPIRVLGGRLLARP